MRRGLELVLMLAAVSLVVACDAAHVTSPRQVPAVHRDLTCRSGYYVIAYDKDSVCVDSIPQ